MNLQAIPALMMSAVCLYVSFYYFIMYSLRKHEKEYLIFSILCFAVFIYDITCTGLYNAKNIETGVFWQRGNFASASLISISLLWFIFSLTMTPFGKKGIILSLYYLIMTPVFIFTDSIYTLTILNPSIKHINPGFRFDIIYFESRPGILCSVFLLITIITYLYLIVILVRHHRSYKNRKTMKIIVSFCLFFIGVINDSFVSTGFYSFIYISEYIFMYIILTMGYTLQINFVRIQEEVENLNINLEQMVADRTIELIEKQKKIEEENEIMNEWRKTMDLELNMARRIQQQIIPENNPADFISAMFIPMEPIGGDFYDFIRFREKDLTGIFISDVSGHGLPAALITTMIKSLISGAGGNKLDPARLFTDLNEILVEQTDENFVTAFYGIYNKTDRTITYSCAGHNPPLLLHNNTVTKLDKARNVPLGIYTNSKIREFNKGFINITETLPVNSKLIFYTDGLTETRSLDNAEYFFEDVLEEKLVTIADFNCRDFVSGLYRELVDFRGNESFGDDVCIICVDIE